jgi:hypothetical protein
LVSLSTLGARRRDSLKPHLDTSNTLFRGFEVEREREPTRRAGQIGTSTVCTASGEGVIARRKKSHRRHGTFPRFRFDAPAYLPTQHRDFGRTDPHPRIPKRRGISGLEKELSATRWIRRRRPGVEIAAPVYRPQRRPKNTASPTLLL